jgi:ketosteroid isomerase-like protein
MTRSEIQALVERFVTAWAGEDIDALLECYDEQAELVSPLLHTVRGLAAIEGAHQDLIMAFADVAADVHDIVVDVENQRAVLVFTIHATQKRADSRRRTAAWRRQARSSSISKTAASPSSGAFTTSRAS